MKGESIFLGDNGECNVTGTGNVRVEKLTNGVWERAVIENVLLVPRLAKNLFSVGACAAKGFRVIFEENNVEISRNGVVEATGVRQSNSLYRMFIREPRSCREANVTALDLSLWHERLGHIHKRAISGLVKRDLVKGVKVKNAEEFFCEVCQLGKLHKLPFNQVKDKVDRLPGELIHSDVCGPMSTQSLGGARFFVLFTDDATSYRHIYFMRHKSEVFDRFKELDQLLENKFGRRLKKLRTDNGTEYRNSKMTEYTRARGIVMEHSAPHTPEQNGKSERSNRTVVESARTMLQAKKLPAHLWAEASNTAVYILNRTGQSAAGGSKTPFELWEERKPNLGHARVFGSEAYERIPKELIKKFDPRAKKTVLVGYDGDSENYRLYDPETRKVSVSRHVVFR